jgi:hypothetical protein
MVANSQWHTRIGAFGLDVGGHQAPLVKRTSSPRQMRGLLMRRAVQRLIATSSILLLVAVGDCEPVIDSFKDVRYYPMELKVVSGVSTGASIAFMGHDNHELLKEAYTKVHAWRLYLAQSLLWREPFTDNPPFRGMIAKNVDEKGIPWLSAGYPT